MRGADWLRGGRAGRSVSGAAAMASVLLVGVLCCGPAVAQPVADFYRGQQIKIVVGGTAAGGYAPYARMLASHMSHYIPGNPKVLVQFMPGAGGLIAANYVYNVAPQDGTVVGLLQRNVVRLAVTRDKGVKYDPRRVQWLGSLHNDVSVCVAWHTSPIKTIHDVMEQELIVGGTGLNDTEQFPVVLNNTLGTKFKIISGYAGVAAANLAMERGEIAGRCGWSWDSLKSQQGAWLRERKINVLVQLSVRRHPEIGDVPLATELAKTSDVRAVLEFIFGEQALGKPFMVGPDVPRERVEALRSAFAKAAIDETATAEMSKLGLSVSLLDGDAMENLVASIYATPQAVIDRAGAATSVRSLNP